MSNFVAITYKIIDPCFWGRRLNNAKKGLYIIICQSLMCVTILNVLFQYKRFNHCIILQFWIPYRWLSRKSFWCLFVASTITYGRGVCPGSEAWSPLSQAPLLSPRSRYCRSRRWSPMWATPLAMIVVRTATTMYKVNSASPLLLKLHSFVLQSSGYSCQFVYFHNLVLFTICCKWYMKKHSKIIGFYSYLNNNSKWWGKLKINIV